VSDSDDANLPDVVASVGEVEAAPLMDIERPQDDVADGTTRAEEGFSLGEELVDAGEAESGFMGESFA
jgi:hypothetical protein